MARATFTIVAVAFLYSAAAAESPPVTFESPCECRDYHGKGRWTAKMMRRLHQIRANFDNKR